MKSLWICFFVFCVFSISAQFDHETVFPDLEDDALRSALIDDFKTSSVLSYSQARDTFFRNIDAVDNVLECVYTGFKITLDPDADPTSDAFIKGVNTEHTYPRSKGALENTLAYSDMHHLFPTRQVVNTARGTLPFGEIVDSQTDKWYFEDDVITFIPSQGIDNYSELLTNVNFEPREKHKGDVARAYFYFYTMYKSLADQEDSDYFEAQRETLCDWHFIDPVDEKEWNRNIKIAEYQGGKRNPFILDCKLARLYCDEIVGSCLMVGIDDLVSNKIKLSPNPTNSKIQIDGLFENLQKYEIVNAQGMLVSKGWINTNENSASIDVGDLQNGFYFIQFFTSNNQFAGVSKFIKI